MALTHVDATIKYVAAICVNKQDRAPSHIKIETTNASSTINNPYKIGILIRHDFQ